MLHLLNYRSCLALYANAVVLDRHICRNVTLYVCPAAQPWCSDATYHRYLNNVEPRLQPVPNWFRTGEYSSETRIATTGPQRIHCLIKHRFGKGWCNRYVIRYTIINLIHIFNHQVVRLQFEQAFQELLVSDLVVRLQVQKGAPGLRFVGISHSTH